MTQITIEQALETALEHHRAGRLADAELFYKSILAHCPDHADALHLLGALACQAGRMAVAIELLGRAIAIDPGAARYHHNLGEAYRRSGQWDGAIASFRRALVLQPGHAETLNNLGVALYESGRTDEAIAAYHGVLDRQPDHPWAHTNLGNALRMEGRLDEAIACYRRAIQLDPGFSEAYNSLGVVLHARGRIDEALAACRRAIELAPEYAEAHNNLGNVFMDQGCLELALDSFRRATAVRPGFSEAASNLLLSLHYHSDYDGQAILAEHRRWAGQFAEPLAAEIQPHPNDRSPEKRLRVGYVSPDFRAHAVGRLLLALFASHDHRQVEVFCYSDVRVPDAFTAELKGLADVWCDTVGLGDTQVAGRIRADRIDILVDLALHTAGNRLLVFARKPAPVQVTMLGLPSTTGLATMDYRLTDPYLDPPGETDNAYTERSIRLPRCFWCYPTTDETAPEGELPAVRNGYLSFGCLNQFSKVSRPVLQTWVHILRSLDGARVVLHAPEGSHRDDVRALFQHGGVAADRVGFVAKVPLSEYMRRYREFDLCLDPFPFCGGSTTLDALWMGVPVITLAGRTAVGRGGVSILSNLGLTELIARTPEQYASIALELARDLSRLAALRSALRPRMQSSPLMDGKQYAADVEAAFRWIWKTWCGS